VIWAGDWSPDPGDEEILRRAAADSRVLVTIDKDFGELVIIQGKLHVGLIRLVGFRSREQGPALVNLLTTYERDLATGAILTAEPWRVRVRPGAVDNKRPSPPAKLAGLKLSFEGEIPPDDIGDGWIRGTKWPLEFSLKVDARFDRAVAPASASLEIVREAGGERVERKVEPIDPSAGPVQQWRGSFKSVCITEPGNYRIVIHVDGVEPVSLRWRIDRK
jgi:predicted nuclease of predicted toxin-antitoxin system